MDQASRGFRYYQYRSGHWDTVESGVIVEKPVSLTVNGVVWLTFMCTPIDLEALAVGFLFNENVIQTKEEIASLHVCASQDNIDVWLNRTIERPKDWRRTSGCTGGMTSTDASAGLPEAARPGPEDRAVEDRAVEDQVEEDQAIISPTALNDLIEQLFQAQGLYKKVGGVHTSILTDGSGLVVSADDIGRHNTLDKIAGRCLLENISPTRRILVTTGRISSEMMQKAARLGATIAISRTSPSSLSIELARQAGITLVGYARRSRFNVYTHPERIASTGVATTEESFSTGSKQLEIKKNLDQDLTVSSEL